MNKIRVSFGAQKIEHKLADLLKKLEVPGKKKGKERLAIISHLVKNWEKVVGTDCALASLPKSARLERETNQMKLTIAVTSSSTGFIIKNNSESIIENIAMLYGYKLVGKIIVKLEPQNHYGVREG